MNFMLHFKYVLYRFLKSVKNYVEKAAGREIPGIVAAAVVSIKIVESGLNITWFH